MEEETLLDERAELIDELVSKAGPTAGQIKLNQDPIKVERLRALGWKSPEPPKKEPTMEERIDKLEATVTEHQKRIDECSVRR